MDLQTLIEKRDLMRGQIQMMQNQPVVEFNDWLHVHAAYGSILVQIDELNNARYIREVQ